MATTPASRRRRIYPNPEAIQPGKWSIGDDIRARVNMTTQQMFVPLADHPQARAIRAHELAHVAFTPKRVPLKKTKGIEENTLQFCEDYRVNTRARMKGVTSFDAGCPERILAGALERLSLVDDPKQYVLLALGMFRQFEVDLVLAQSSDSRVQRVYDRAVKMFNRGLKARSKARLTFDHTIMVARYIDAEFATGDISNGVNENVSTPLDASSLSRAWGQARIETPRLSAPKKQRGPKCSDSGSVFRAPWRVTSDQRVFKSCLKAPRRGTVLVDASGSMHLTAADIETLAKRIPAGTIAAYCGNGTEGVIRILARNGKLADSEQCDLPYGGNVIDGPALLWLGKQQSPRTWVCDGRVTGVDDREQAHLTNEAHTLQNRYGIYRVPDMASAFVAVKGR